MRLLAALKCFFALFAPYMIQRIQSVYLALLIILMATLCAIPVIKFSAIQENGIGVTYTLNLFYLHFYEGGNLVQTQLQWGLVLITSGIIGLAVITLFGFKQRKKQLLYCKINFILMLMLVAAFVAMAYSKIPGFNINNLLLPSIIGMALLIFMFYLNYRALYHIQKDEELIKSADRIR